VRAKFPRVINLHYLLCNFLDIFVPNLLFHELSYSNIDLFICQIITASYAEQKLKVVEHGLKILIGALKSGFEFVTNAKIITHDVKFALCH